MYVNLKKWREDHIELLFKKCILEHNGNVPHHDQGTLNSVCRGKILFLDPRYNLYDTALFYRAEELIQLFDLPRYYTQSEMETAKKNPVIIHFTPAHYGRPWFRKCNHPFVKEYRKFLKKTMWKEKLIKEPHEVKKNNIRTIKKLLYKRLPFSIYCHLIKKVSEVR